MADAPKKKNRAAVALAKQRSESLSAERRQEIGQAAIRARWDPERLRPEQLGDLREFLRRYHPPFSAEVEHMVQKKLVSKLPIILRLLYDDMERHRNGLPTKNVHFLPLDNPPGRHDD